MKLYSEKMGDTCYDDPNSDLGNHTVPYHRVWMTAEYDIMTPEEVEKEKEKWDSETLN